MLQKEHSSLAYLIMLLAACLAAYWPLSLHLFSLKNDAINYFLPVRFFISEAIAEGYLPLWTPYLNLGYPVHADMQSGAWNPFVWLFSLAGPYSLRMLQYETLLYVYLSGVSMFYLANHLVTNRKIAFFAASAYMLCGYNSDSAQFLTWIASAAFLPFVFLFYLKTISANDIRAALLTAVFLALLITCGYPADFILTAYLMAAMLCWYWWKNKSHCKKVWPLLVKVHAVMIIAFLLLCLPAIVSFTGSLKLLERGGGVSYINAMDNSLHPGMLISYLTPMATWKATFAAITNPLGRNNFIGVIALGLSLVAFRIHFSNSIFGFGKYALIIFLLFSFGPYGLIRSFAFHLLPLMNTFRHPANARLFTIFFGCLLASGALNFIDRNRQQNLGKYPVTFLLATTCGFILCGLIFSKQLGITNLFSSKAIKDLLDRLEFYDMLALNGFLQLPFLVCLFLYSIKKLSTSNLIWLSCINVLIQTALMQPFSVIKNDRAHAIQKLLNKVQVRGYPLPNVAYTIKENSAGAMQFFDEIGTINLYNKKIGRTDFFITPSNLISQSKFWNNKELTNLLTDYPLVYKADRVIYPRKDGAVSTEFISPLLLLDHPKALNQHRTDSATSIEFISFGPNRFVLNISANDSGVYGFFQNYHPRWRLFIDGRKTKPHLINVSFIGFNLSAGKHTVEGVYSQTDLVFCIYVSLITLLTIITLLSFRKIQAQKQHWWKSLPLF